MSITANQPPLFVWEKLSAIYINISNFGFFSFFFLNCDVSLLFPVADSGCTRFGSSLSFSETCYSNWFFFIRKKTTYLMHVARCTGQPRAYLHEICDTVLGFDHKKECLWLDELKRLTASFPLFRPRGVPVLWLHRGLRWLHELRRHRGQRWHQQQGVSVSEALRQTGGRSMWWVKQV